MVGRRPKPTAVHILRGNPSKKRLNQAEPRVPTDEVVKPGGLSPEASKVWDTLAPIAIGMRTLTPADVKAFSSLCELQGTFAGIVAEKSVSGYKPVFWGEDETGAPLLLIHPLLRLERDTAGALRHYYAAFGLEPSSRSRIVIPAPKAVVSKWA